MEETLGKRIVYNRKRLGLTQDQLAEKVGVTAQAVSKWENDQSCPDITMLPRLAELFGITTDALLGREEQTVHSAEVVEEDENEGFHVRNGKWEFTYDGGRRAALQPAVYVLGFGVLLLISRIFHQEASFWNLLWPWSLAFAGFFGMLRRFSFFPIGLFLFGTYFLLDNMALLPFSLGGELVFPAVIVLLGLSLLADALRKPGKSRWRIHTPGGKNSGNLVVDGDTFSYSTSFGESRQKVYMPMLREGSITTSFGEFTVDLSGVERVSPDCEVAANCSFGELHLLIPSRYEAVLDNSTAFAEIRTSGRPQEQPEGIVRVCANVSFGEIHLQYI